MKIVRGDGRDVNDDEVRDALRSLYAPPSEESYWETLERGVMARVRAETAREWWSHFPGWVRIGVAAAAAVLAISSVASWHTRSAQARLAYEELDFTTADLPVLTESLGSEPNESVRDATLRYLITHD
jgi:hypothetical protein